MTRNLQIHICTFKFTNFILFLKKAKFFINPDNQCFLIKWSKLILNSIFD